MDETRDSWDEDEEPGTAEAAQANPGYASFQIAKALTSLETHGDAAVRERARNKIAQWTQVLHGMLGGTLDVGSRTPRADVPAWATLEVVTGGFATGELLGAGPLLEHERALAAKLAPVPDHDKRRVLHAYYLSDDGLTQLQEMLRSGTYDVTIPEEGALLVVAWLAQHAYAEEARALLDELAPYFPKLRFYPMPLPSPRPMGSRVFLQDVGSAIEDLAKIQPNARILVQREAIQVWAPLYDQMVSLFLETVEGEPPHLRRGPAGERIPVQHGRFPVEGGWPCQRYPEGWKARAQATLDECRNQRRAHLLCGKPDRSKDSFAQLRQFLSRCIENPRALSGREVGRIRLILARSNAKRGTPGSPQATRLRDLQAVQAAAPTFYDVNRVVIPRLEVHPRDGGIEDDQTITQPVTAAEAERWSLPAGTLVPRRIQRKVARCASEPIEVLVERGVITSGETLARVLPQVTAGIRAAGITEPTLRQLYSTIYRAFRRRRSLLLLNLESQVKLEELPWVAAIDRFRAESLSTRELAKQTLEEVTMLSLVSFPHAILPNKLLQELRALAQGAKLDLPLVDELAADIFMGRFSDKFQAAALRAANLLEGTLYATYYGIDYSDVKRLAEGRRSWFQWFSGDRFAELCESRAGATARMGDPATNGTVIEQQQILTTQNLAVLVDGLHLADALRDRLGDMASRCFDWICRYQQVPMIHQHASLIMVKQTAYAWRQMIFFLALQPPTAVRTFVTWAGEHLKKQGEAFQARFNPAVAGLTLAAKGHSPDGPEAVLQGARRFLGWTREPHWLLE